VRHGVLGRGDLASTTLLLAGLKHLKLEISPSVGLTSQGQSFEQDRLTTSSKSKFVSVIVRSSVNILRVKRSDILSMLLHESETVFTKFANGKAHLSGSNVSGTSSGLSITELELSRGLDGFSATLE